MGIAAWAAGQQNTMQHHDTTIPPTGSAGVPHSPISTGCRNHLPEFDEARAAAVSWSGREGGIDHWVAPGASRDRRRSGAFRPRTPAHRLHPRGLPETAAFRLRGRDLAARRLDHQDKVRREAQGLAADGLLDRAGPGPRRPCLLAGHGQPAPRRPALPAHRAHPLGLRHQLRPDRRARGPHRSDHQSRPGRPHRGRWPPSRDSDHTLSREHLPAGCHPNRARAGTECGTRSGRHPVAPVRKAHGRAPIWTPCTPW